MATAGPAAPVRNSTDKVFNTSALANDAAVLASALQRSSTALSSLAISVSDSLAEAANVSHTASTLVHLGSRSVASQVASPSGPVSQAADLVARADELAALLADKIISLHEDVRAIHLALDLLESRVSQLSLAVVPGQVQSQSPSPPTVIPK
ncbi:hypothetical protein BCR44DRAFT_45423 [Catenaria anguillulae PL171]|uniref:Uncharacterized protein n=1 Tax=Catenaria anguillulae PL171 TaxID=765915 RepID=A0A1Y2H915_9FUNG|nr:hypothetical protein BCR44DRAFT_45423 [Catenaria anguillulae PL171]